MAKKYLLVIGGIITLIGILFFISAEIYWQYQEDANVTSLDGSWSNGANTYDGNWDAYSSCNSPAGYYSYLYVNYSKPDNSQQSTSYWDVKDEGNRVNLTIPSGCWNYNSSTLILRGVSSGHGLAPCLKENTLIKTQNGYKEIKDMKIGDLVYSYNDKTNKIEVKEVLGVSNNSIKNAKNKYYKVSYKNSYIKVTYDHSFLTKEGYIKAENLKVGQEIFLISEKWTEIKNIEIEENYKDFVWDLEIKDNHNFFANDILVHNEVSGADSYGWECYNESWITLRTGSEGSHAGIIYEEAMWWDISEAEIIKQFSLKGNSKLSVKSGGRLSFKD